MHKCGCPLLSQLCCLGVCDILILVPPLCRVYDHYFTDDHVAFESIVLWLALQPFNGTTTLPDKNMTEGFEWEVMGGLIWVW